MYTNVCLFYGFRGCVVSIYRNEREREYQRASLASKMRLAALVNQDGWDIRARSYGWEAFPPAPEPESDDADWRDAYYATA